MARNVLLCVAVLAIAASHSVFACWFPENSKPTAHKRGSSQTQCTAVEAEAQYTKFMNNLHKIPIASACAEHWWLRYLQDEATLHVQADSTRKQSWRWWSSNSGTPRSSYVLADVGCNKAYFTAAALNHLVPEYGDHLQLLHQQHAKFPLYEHPCGMCRECQQGPKGPLVVKRTPEDAPKNVDVLCYEPSEVHVARLTQTRDLLYGEPSVGSRQDGKPKVNFNVFHAAVSNSTGVARFPRNCTTNICSLSVGTAAPVEVMLTTFDTQMEARGLTRVDVLKIDTEGYDPAVLAGAYKALSERRVNALSFEYHYLWDRTNTTLRQCLDYLETFGYSCYYDADIVAKLTGCWVPQYEMRRWMNVVCALADGPLDKALTERSWFRLQG